MKCIIDLDKNVLRINSANVETRFLSESELPEFARPAYESMEDEPVATTSSNTASNGKKFIIFLLFEY